MTEGNYSFTHPTTGYRYEGAYVDGKRAGLWRVLRPDGSLAWETMWAQGVWHGRSTSYWVNGTKESEGEYAEGKRSGQWSFWFSDGQVAARGRYEADRKVGDWSYRDEQGNPMDKEAWSTKFEEWDWAFDDYTGFPRGENWPKPPELSAP